MICWWQFFLLRHNGANICWIDLSGGLYRRIGQSDVGRDIVELGLGAETYHGRVVWKRLWSRESLITLRRSAEGWRGYFGWNGFGWRWADRPLNWSDMRRLLSLGRSFFTLTILLLDPLFVR